MGERGRKSTAALSVIAGGLDQRPEAPSDLTEEQVEVWDRTVAHEAAAVFGTAALQQMLKDYCRHVVSAEVLAAMVEVLEAMPVEEWSSTHLDAYDKALKMRDRETKAVADKATKLRLTNQSRYTPKTAGTAAKNAGNALKPWN